MIQVGLSNRFRMRQDFTILESYHCGNHCIFHCNDHKVSNINTLLTLPNNLPEMRTSLPDDVGLRCGKSSARTSGHPCVIFYFFAGAPCVSTIAQKIGSIEMNEGTPFFHGGLCQDRALLFKAAVIDL